MACTAANRAHADIWKQIWAAIDDFGLEYITVEKVQAHLSLTSVQDGSAGVTWQDWQGNRVADAQAKLGAACHPAKADMKELLETGRSLVTFVAKWLGTLGVFLVGLNSPDIQPKQHKVPVRLIYGGTSSYQELTLIEIPANAGDMSGWKPRVLHREQKHIVSEGDSGVDADEAGMQPPPGVSQVAGPSHGNGEHAEQ